VLLLAPTGKAAVRLREVTKHAAATIHSTIYEQPVPTADMTPESVTIDGEPLLKDVVTGQIYTQAEWDRELARRARLREKYGKDALVWIPKDTSEGPIVGPETLVIVDEGSMVSDKLMADLYSALAPDTRVLWVGDHCQLRPVEGKPGPNLDQPDVLLTKVHRQALDSPILRLATHLRELPTPTDLWGVFRRHADGKALVAVEKHQMRPGEWLARTRRSQESGQMAEGWDATLLCWTNRTRHATNHGVRDLLGRPGNQIVPGDRLLVRQSARDAGVMNGMVLRVQQISPGGSTGREDVPGDLYEVWSPDAPRPFFVHPSLFAREREAWLKECRDQGRKWCEKHAEVAAGARRWTERRWQMEHVGWKSAGSPRNGRYGPARMLVHTDFGECLTVHSCLHPDTLVETEMGLLPIRSIARAGTIATPDGPRRYESPTVNPPGPALCITTEDGYSLTVTPEHGLDVWSNSSSGYTRREARDLAPGDWLRLRLGVTCEPYRPALLPGPPGVDARAHVTKLPWTVTSDFAEWLGMFVADGTLYERGFRLVKRHRDVVERFAALTLELFGVDAQIERADEDKYDEEVWRCEVSSAFIATWLRLLGGLQPHGKAVPDCVLRSPSRLHGAFVRGLSIDGSVHVKDGVLDHIELKQKGRGTIETVRTMLLRLGIVSSKVSAARDEAFGMHNITIYGHFAALFAERVGFVAAFHRDRAATARVLAPTRYRVPVTWDEAGILPLQGDRDNARNRGYVSRAKLSEALAAARALAATTINDRLDWHHVRITSIEPVECPSMCVEVPDGHRFLQNGIAGWNSQGSEWAVVGILGFDTGGMLRRGEPDAWPDARRWWYTAVTRAREGLAIWL